MNIKSIPTTYNGYLCRSRVEARWMCFFDTLGIKYTYETQGFEMTDSKGSIVRYLPDFFIEEWNVWIEIKGPTPNDQERVKAQSLSDATDKTVWILAGEPFQGYFIAFVFKPNSQMKIDREFKWPIDAEKAKNLSHAYTTARQARFEHGQNGPPSQWNSGVPNTPVEAEQILSNRIKKREENDSPMSDDDFWKKAKLLEK